MDPTTSRWLRFGMPFCTIPIHLTSWNWVSLIYGFKITTPLLSIFRQHAQDIQTAYLHYTGWRELHNGVQTMSLVPSIAGKKGWHANTLILAGHRSNYLYCSTWPQ